MRLILGYKCPHFCLIHSIDMTSVKETWSKVGFQDFGEIGSSTSLSVTSFEEGIKSRILLWSGLKLKTLLDNQESRNELYLYMRTMCIFITKVARLRSYFPMKISLLIPFLSPLLLFSLLYLCICKFLWGGVRMCAGFLLLLKQITINLVFYHKFIIFQLCRSEV